MIYVYMIVRSEEKSRRSNHLILPNKIRIIAPGPTMVYHFLVDFKVLNAFYLELGSTINPT